MSGTEALRHESLDGLTNQFLAAVSKQLLRSSVDEAYQTLTVDHEHRIRGGFDNQTKALFGSFAFSNVDDAREDKRPFTCFDRIESDLNRNLAAILAQAIKFPAGAHRPGRRIL